MLKFDFFYIFRRYIRIFIRYIYIYIYIIYIHKYIYKYIYNIYIYIYIYTYIYMKDICICSVRSVGIILVPLNLRALLIEIDVFYR